MLLLCSWAGLGRSCLLDRVFCDDQLVIRVITVIIMTSSGAAGSNIETPAAAAAPPLPDWLYCGATDIEGGGAVAVPPDLLWPLWINDPSHNFPARRPPARPAVIAATTSRLISRFCLLPSSLFNDYDMTGQPTRRPTVRLADQVKSWVW